MSPIPQCLTNLPASNAEDVPSETVATEPKSTEFPARSYGSGGAFGFGAKTYTTASNRALC